MSDEPVLSGEEIQEETIRRLRIYEERSFLEQYAIFMGKAQILEFGLKSLLNQKYDISVEDTKQWTLGRVKGRLKELGLRPDFIKLLESVVGYRNYIAHDLLADNALLSSYGELSHRKQSSEIAKGAYELEQLFLLFDWCNKQSAWD